jgi:hypothetical protein
MIGWMLLVQSAQADLPEAVRHACVEDEEWWASRACECLVRLKPEAWEAQVPIDKKLTGTCFQVYQVMDVSPADPFLQLVLEAKAENVARARFGRGLLFDDTKRLVSFDEKIAISGPIVFLFEGNLWRVSHVDLPLLYLQTNGVAPLEGYFGQFDQDQDQDLYVVFGDGDAWMISGPLSANTIVTPPTLQP